MKKTVAQLLLPGIIAAAAANPHVSGAQPAPQHLTADQIRLRETEVLEALDLTRPELRDIASAWRSGESAGAARALAAYLRARSSVPWGPATGSPAAALSEQEREVADDAVHGRLQGGQVPISYTFPDAGIDWHYNATDHIPGVAHDNEWQWQLNRMGVWYALGDAYRATGDERYARAFDREMAAWIAQCPPADHTDNEVGSSWRTIEAGIRMGGSWPVAFFAFRRSPSVSDTDLVLFLSSFLDHARYLRAHPTQLNFLTMEMSGLYAAGALFPEFRDAADWRRFAAVTLAGEARRQFLPDGAQVELSTEYQNVALSNILEIPQFARWTGHLSELPADYGLPLERGLQYELSIMAPDRFLPRYNNGLPQYLPKIFMRLARGNFPDRADFRWVETDGAEGSPPAFTSIYLNRAGEAAMRSGWGRGDNYLGLRLGPLGMAHRHQDKLDVVIWAYGRPILFNTGGGSYELSKWRTWATSSFGSNCLIVDGLGQNRPITAPDPWHDPDLISQGPIDAHWQSTPVYDFASGEYSGPYGPEGIHPATQQRDVLFLKPDLFIVADRVQPSDTSRHTYQARWQLLTTSTELDPATRTLVTLDAGQPNLAIVPLLGEGLEVKAVSGQEFPEILGWNVRKDMDPQNVPATTLLHTRTGDGPQRILTLFVPLHPGQGNPIAKVTEGRDGASAAVVFRDGRRLAVAAPGGRGITVQETLPDGRPGRSAATAAN